MNIRLFFAALAALGSLAAPAADPERFVWRFDVLESPTGPVSRLALEPAQMAELYRDDARDWQLVDAQGRTVPAALLPAEALLESRLETTELEFEQSLIDDIETDSSPLTLDIERGDTRVLIQGPDRPRQPEDGRLIFEALIAAPASVKPAAGRWLALEMQADQRVRLDCRFGDADAKHAGIDRFGFQELGDARPRRYRGRESVAEVPSAWYVSCYAGQVVQGLRLVRASLAEERRVDHRRSAVIRPAEVRLQGDGSRVEFDLPGPFKVKALGVSSRESGLFSQLRVQSRSSADQPWRDRARLTLSTLNDDIEATTGLAEPVRERQWRLLATPPLRQAPDIEIHAHTDEIAFLAQGEGPWRLLIGSREPGDERMPSDVLDDLISSQGPAWHWPQVSLGERRQAGGPAALEVPPDPIPWQRYMLWAVLVAACLLVLGLAVRLLRGS